MLSNKLIRTITSLTPKGRTIVSRTSPLLLDSYCEPDPQLYTYYKNQEIDGLIKSGELSSAQKLFDEMRIGDVVTYNLLISGHGKYGNPKQALFLYNEMVSHGIKESASTFSSVTSICSNFGFYEEGMQVHCRLVSLGFERNLYIGSALIDLYMRMGFDDKALRLFDELPERNLATWNLMLRWFCEVNRSDELLRLYGEMKFIGVGPNQLSFCYVIRGCSNKRFLSEGRQLHCDMIKLGWVDMSTFVANSLVDFYSACGCLTDARKSFEVISAGDVISWNSIVSVFADHGLVFDAVELFSRMQFWRKRPSIRSFIGFLNLASGTGNIDFGKQIHCYILKMGFDHRSVHIQSALIDMYGKCNDIGSSVAIFEAVPERTLECCNSLMTSFLHCGIILDAIEMFGLMVDEGVGFDEVSLSTTLKALSVSAWANMSSCRLLHCVAIKAGFEYETAVSCSLIDAYSRCGHVELSQQVFDKIPSPNVVCFTSIINGYARNGMGRECLDMLEAMIQKGVTPDEVTFLCVLSGCNHSGMVKEGRMVFNSMRSIYGIEPERRHYSCMIDLLGRAGLLNEAEELLLQTPGKGDCVIWSSLLRSCRVHGNEIVGRRIAKNLMELEPKDFAVYLQVSNFYSEIGEFELSMQIREVAVARKVTWDIGHSLIEVNNFH
ncbi:putative pentatricopeptide repeat-containing protein At3g47840 [Pistacia vera]|uniref:putative pentatricopeptide repeat-containing protein At3g47840 n=1 Tax=Pistacia vera TaxID=55513 RepID=UPI0012631164|nr:putative pentatricopeptide repeat-containing protein At3g47840 [Pistacia vera]